jgi:Uma2 family endonuclease
MNLALVGVPLPLRFKPETPMSDDELLRFCAANEVLRVERDANGEILVMTPAGTRTGRKNTAIISALDAWAVQDDRGYAFDSNTGFTLPDGSMRSPDAAWVEASRWDAMSEPDKDRFSPLCPDFIIELRSQSDSLPALETKMEQWIANGAQLAWLIDPQRKVVVVYRTNCVPEICEHPTSIKGDGIIVGFELPLSRVWD